MKVVHINAVYEYSSTGRSLMELHNALKKNGIESYVFCTNYTDELNNIYTIGSFFSRKIHAFLSRVTGLQGYYSIHATKRLLKKISIIKPDIVKLDNLHANYVNVNMLLDYLIKEQIPTVIVLHDCWLFTGHCCHYLEDSCNRWQTGCGKCPARHKWNKSWLFDRSHKVWRDRKERFSKLKSLTVIGVSDWIVNECKKSFMKDNATFFRIYNWVDTNQFSPSIRKNVCLKKMVLSVAQSWCSQKGLDDIIKVAYENPQLEFAIIGEVSEMKTLPNNVKCEGVINNIDELIRWYRKASVLLLLSKQETFGKVVIEALSCGTPAIVYNNTALPELIKPGCGEIVNNGDIHGVSQAIKRLVNGDYSEICRSYAISEFNSKKLIPDYINVFKQILKEDELL